MNEQTVLAIVHLFMVREHNRIARELGSINHHWEDEVIFQETRHIMAAIIQHITYNEFLPLVLGEDIMFEHGLSLHQVREDLVEKSMNSTLVQDGYFGGYDPSVNPTATNSFVSQVFR